MVLSQVDRTQVLRILTLPIFRTCYLASVERGLRRTRHRRPILPAFVAKPSPGTRVHYPRAKKFSHQQHKIMLQWLRLGWSPLDFALLFLFGAFLLLTESRLKWVIVKRKTTSSGPPDINKKIQRLGIKDIPGPRALPILGTRWVFSRIGPYDLTKVHEAYQQMYQRYGSIFREEALWNFPVVSVVDPVAIQKVFKHSGKTPLRPPTEVTAYYRASRPDRYSNLGLINEQGETWHNLRSVLTPELTSVKTVNRFLDEQNKIADDFVALIRRVRDDSNVVHGFEELANRLGLEVICSLILDRRMGFLNEEVDNPLFAKLAEAVRAHFCASRDTFYGLPFWKVFPSQIYDDFVKSEEVIYEIISEFVERALEEENNTCNVSGVQSVFMSILQTEGLDIRDKKAAIIDFIAAGITTLGNTLVFLMCLVSKRKEVQERLREELSKVMTKGGNLTTEALRKTTYLRACIAESFRLLPTAPCVARILETDLQLGAYHLDKGSVVLCQTWMACLEESNFTRSREYLPERWLGEAGRTSSHLVTPFGHGRRMCPGKRFSEQELHVILAKLVTEFTFEYEDELELKFEFLLSPKGPINLRFIDRE